MIRNIIFDPQNKYMVIGEDHDGRYVFNFNNPVHIDNLLLLIKANNNRITFWFEGSTRGAISRSFNNFYNDTESFFRKQKMKVSCSIQGWEEDGIKHDPVDTIASVTLGVSEQAAMHKLSNYLDGKRSLMDAIVESRQFRHNDNDIHTREDYINALMENNRQSEILEFMLRPGTATASYVQMMYRNDNAAMRAKYFEGSQGALTGSKVYQRIKRFNTDRDRHLKEKLRNGGIFLAGDDHLTALMKMI